MQEKQLTECSKSIKMRARRILDFWDRGKELSIKNKKYKNFLQKFLYFLLEEDIDKGDMTTNSLVKNKKKILAYIVAKEDGIIAGLEEFKLLNKDLKLKFFKKDGDRVRNKDIISEIKGDAKKILSRERVFLNLLQRMSGIATMTNNLNKKLDNNIKIAATRKTMWGLLDKKAVSIGGGVTHRLNLNDGIIIKDNHLKILNYDIEKALKIVKNKSRCIEIEVENKKQALIAAKTIKKIFSKRENFFAIMLDKIPPKQVKSIIKELKDQNLYDYVLLEASGNITPENLSKYSDCGVDIISMGYLTNSAESLDISLEIL